MVSGSDDMQEVLKIKEYYNALDISGFSMMLKDPSYCYKFYWLEAIVNLITANVTETDMNTVIEEMICNAWYSVREYHIHLSGIQADGEIRDGLERAVLKLAQLSDLPANASKTEILNELHRFDQELGDAKLQLTKMVPYRALAGFFANANERADWNSVRRLTAFIEHFSRTKVALPYIFTEGSGLNRKILFHPDWIEMIRDNAVPILGWIRFEKVRWLQNNNPEVPGLVYKLQQADEKVRKLENVHKLWDGILEQTDIRDVFTGRSMAADGYDIDHFIPWSFVMNDELWNLMPMDSSLNAMKSNKLPKWDPFFSRFAKNQFAMYELIRSSEHLYDLYKKCWRYNLHSIWAGQELYRPGNSEDTFRAILERNMRPVYDSARRQGYEFWQEF